MERIDVNDHFPCHYWVDIHTTTVWAGLTGAARHATFPSRQTATKGRRYRPTYNSRVILR